jgi:hypothetical protein
MCDVPVASEAIKFIQNFFKIGSSSEVKRVCVTYRHHGDVISLNVSQEREVG